MLFTAFNLAPVKGLMQGIDKYKMLKSMNESGQRGVERSEDTSFK